MQIQIIWLHQKPTDLDLHCLQRQDISGTSRTRVKVFFGVYFFFFNCYDLALLHSKICLGRFRRACRYILNLWQLHQGVDSLAQWLEYWIFIRADWVQIPQKAGIFFSYASVVCYNPYVVRQLNDIDILITPQKPCGYLLEASQTICCRY